MSELKNHTENSRKQMTLQEIREAMANVTYVPLPDEDWEKDWEKDWDEEIKLKEPDQKCVMCSGTGEMYATEGAFTTCLCCYDE